MITLAALTAVLAVALFLFGVAVIVAADNAEKRDSDLEAILFAEQFVDELNTEAERWR